MMWFEIVAGKNAGQKFPIQSEADCLRMIKKLLDSGIIAIS